MYDLIGDVHGHADELIFLLEELGYDRRRGGTYGHPVRQAVFVGDLIDRGPNVREVLQIVRAMVDSGRALCVMGNHEYNALTYHTRHPDDPNRFLRKRNVREGKNVRQHFQTLRQLPPAELYESLEWFRQLPLWLELDGLRVVHACWHQPSMDVIRNRLGENGLSTEFLMQSTNPEHPLFAAVEDVLKGKELSLPEGVTFHDKDGHLRRKLRVKWFESPENQTYHTYALQSGEEFPSLPVPAELQQQIDPYRPDEPPVFIGHYWLHAESPAPLAPNVACLDYSVAKGGLLCAYRWNGEQQLTAEHFVSVRSFRAG